MEYQWENNSKQSPGYDSNYLQQQLKPLRYDDYKSQIWKSPNRNVNSIRKTSSVINKNQSDSTSPQKMDIQKQMQLIKDNLVENNIKLTNKIQSYKFPIIQQELIYKMSELKDTIDQQQRNTNNNIFNRSLIKPIKEKIELIKKGKTQNVTQGQKEQSIQEIVKSKVKQIQMRKNKCLDYQQKKLHQILKINEDNFECKIVQIQNLIHQKFDDSNKSITYRFETRIKQYQKQLLIKQIELKIKELKKQKKIKIEELEYQKEQKSKKLEKQKNIRKQKMVQKQEQFNNFYQQKLDMIEKQHKRQLENQFKSKISMKKSQAKYLEIKLKQNGQLLQRLKDNYNQMVKSKQEQIQQQKKGIIQYKQHIYETKKHIQDNQQSLKELKENLEEERIKFSFVQTGDSKFQIKTNIIDIEDQIYQKEQNIKELKYQIKKSENKLKSHQQYFYLFKQQLQQMQQNHKEQFYKIQIQIQSQIEKYKFQSNSKMKQFQDQQTQINQKYQKRKEDCKIQIKKFYERQNDKIKIQQNQIQYKYQQQIQNFDNILNKLQLKMLQQEQSFQRQFDQNKEYLKDQQNNLRQEYQRNQKQFKKQRISQLQNKYFEFYDYKQCQKVKQYLIELSRFKKFKDHQIAIYAQRKQEQIQEFTYEICMVTDMYNERSQYLSQCYKSNDFEKAKIFYQQELKTIQEHIESIQMYIFKKNEMEQLKRNFKQTNKIYNQLIGQISYNKDMIKVLKDQKRRLQNKLNSLQIQLTQTVRAKKQKEELIQDL